MVAPRGGAKLGTAVLELTADDAKLNRGLDDAHRRAGGTFGAIGKLGTAAFIGIGAAAVGGLGSSIMLSATFEQRLDVLQATAGATGGEMARLSAHAKALGADISLPGTSASDAAEAMLELSKAGLSVTDTLDGARGVLQLSAAGQLSNAEAAEIAANALNAFSLRGSEATRVADLLAASANASSASVQDVGLSLKQSAALAASAGVPIEDLVTTIGQLANAGIKGSDAGTSMRAMLLHLQAPSETARKQMRAIGLEVYDAAGNMKSLREIIEDTETATHGLTQEERDFALATIFGSDAVRAINVLLAQGTAGFDKMKTATTRQGAAAQLAAAYNKGLKGALDAVKSSAETLAISIGTPMLEGLAGLARGVAGAISAIEPLAHYFAVGFNGGKFVEAVEGANTAAFNLGRTLKDVVEFVDGIPGRLDQVIDDIRKRDWGGLGKDLGALLMDGLEELAKEGARLTAVATRLVQSVDWEEQGRSVAYPVMSGFAKGMIERAPGALMEIAKFMVNYRAFIDALINMAIDVAKGFVRAFVTEVKNEIRNFGRSEAEEIGRGVAGGLANGITAAAPGPLRAIGGVVGEVIDDARNRLESESPSRVFMEIGADAMTGFAMGISQNAEEVARTMADAVDGIRAQLRDEQIGAFFAGPQALADMRAQHAMILSEAGRLADDLQGVFGLDDVTAMDKALAEILRRRDAALAASTQVARVARDERAELAERLASVGRLMPRIEPRGGGGNTFNITIPVTVDAQGRYDSRALADAIGVAVVPRIRETIAEGR